MKEEKRKKEEKVKGERRREGKRRRRRRTISPLLLHRFRNLLNHSVIDNLSTM